MSLRFGKLDRGEEDKARGAEMLTGLRKIAEIHKGDMRLTANQNVIIANVSKDERATIEALVAQYRLSEPSSGLRRNAMACVALPTCGLALAESERYLPTLLTALDEKLAASGLSEDDIVIRMTGLPERLRAAISRRDRFGRQGPRPLQPLSRRRVRRLAVGEALRGGSGTRRNCRRARSAVCRLCQGAPQRRTVWRLCHSRRLCGADQKWPGFP